MRASEIPGKCQAKSLLKVSLSQRESFKGTSVSLIFCLETSHGSSSRNILPEIEKFPTIMIACLEVRWCPFRVSELNMPSAELSEGTSWCYFLVILLLEHSTWKFLKVLFLCSSGGHFFSFCFTIYPLWFSIHPVVCPSLCIWINYSICFFLVLENYLSFKIH